MKPFATLLLVSGCTPALAPAAFAAPRYAHAHHHARHIARVHAPAYDAARGYAPRNSGYAYPGYGYDGGYGYRGSTSANADATLNGNSFNAGAAQIPQPGTYNGYEGPGATVLRRGLEAQFDPGATSEISPGAKQTATGGPSGGVPGFGGGR